jgi:hypothetical protein
MIYELRIYHAMPGKLPVLLNRFDTITLPIWERLGIRQAGFWTVGIGDNNHDLYYLLAWDSLADREARWPVFMADPEWQEKKAGTEANGPLISSYSNQILEPTAFSSVR